MPVPGGAYTQFSFEYTVPRRLGGLSVAGQKNFSTTIHTFFVLGDDYATAFASYFEDKIKDVTEMPYTASEHDEAAPAVDELYNEGIRKEDMPG